MSREFESQGIDPQLMLGSFDTTGSVAKRYDSLRRQAATRMLSALSLQDSEFVRRQSDVNGEFLTDILNSIPRAYLKFELDERETFGLGDTYHVGVLRNLMFKYSVDVSGSEYSQITGDIIAEIAAFRSASIWIKRPKDDLVRISREGAYVDASVEGGKILAPHVIIGHKVNTNNEEVDLLLAPNVTTHRQIKSSFGAEFNIHENHIRLGKEDTLGGNIVLNRVLSILKSTLPLSQYLNLIAMQDALMTEELSDTEIKRLYKPNDGDLLMSSDDIPSITAREVKTFKYKKAPNTVAQLESEQYDIKIGETLPLSITPEMFAEYSMLEDAQRLCAMLGRYDVFEAAKNKLVDKSLKDPALKLVEGYKS